MVPTFTHRAEPSPGVVLMCSVPDFSYFANKKFSISSEHPNNLNIQTWFVARQYPTNWRHITFHPPRDAQPRPLSLPGSPAPPFSCHHPAWALITGWGFWRCALRFSLFTVVLKRGCERRCGWSAACDRQTYHSKTRPAVLLSP